MNAPTRIHLAGLLPQEIAASLAALADADAKPYRARQIFECIAAAKEIGEMTSLPLTLREQLAKTACVFSGTVLQTLTDTDGSAKLQIAFGSTPDTTLVETVLLQDESGRQTACLSCQAGCAMGCVFCKTGILGLQRNLEAAEIIEQFLLLEKKFGTIDNIVFMGMGEPMHNLAAIKKTLDVLGAGNGRNLSMRRITVSTAGIVSGIRELAAYKLPLKLAVSLTSAVSATREKIMPITKTNPLPLLKTALIDYAQVSGRRCTLEAVMLSGINTSNAEIEALGSFALDTSCHVNLIPWNPVDSIALKSATSKEIDNALRLLKTRGVNVTVRTRRGKHIAGACGQLGSAC
ncbi:MAG: 23S rRNA (adenine(2503)-C(2))-methyltransferase RlmN [Treponemataceae bacterium]|nr:MAG: 23S rRNA (adenine(2503)-C(2))-methyltransferase RlmN [Treponemataceae bacterium]